MTPDEINAIRLASKLFRNGELEELAADIEQQAPMFAVEELHSYVKFSRGALKNLLRHYSLLAGYLAERETLHPIADLHEDHGAVLLWKVPIDEPPHVSCCLDDDFADTCEHYGITHWSVLPTVEEP